MATADRLGLSEESSTWRKKADRLKQSIRENFTLANQQLAYFKDRNGRLEQRSDALGTAFAVLFGVVEGDEAKKAILNYPVTEAGVPLFSPFYDGEQCYHNNAAWPFVDTFFLKALEKVDETKRTDLNFALLGRTCRTKGTFLEVVEVKTGEVRGSKSQLWSAAAFVDTCRRAGLLD